MKKYRISFYYQGAQQFARWEAEELLNKLNEK